MDGWPALPIHLIMLHELFRALPCLQKPIRIASRSETELIRSRVASALSKRLRTIQPLIPASSYALFKRIAESDDLEGKMIFLRHSKIHDLYTGGDWTIRRFHRLDCRESGDDWQHTTIMLEAESIDFPPVTIELKPESSIQVLGEFVLVVETKENVQTYA